MSSGGSSSPPPTRAVEEASVLVIGGPSTPSLLRWRSRWIRRESKADSLLPRATFTQHPMVATAPQLHPPPLERPGEQRVRLSGIPWQAYVAFRDAVDSPGVRMTCCEGELEILSPLPSRRAPRNAAIGSAQGASTRVRRSRTSTAPGSDLCGCCAAWVFPSATKPTSHKWPSSISRDG